MFKLGVITDEISQDFQTVVKVCTDYDLEAVEIRSVDDKPPQDLQPADVDMIKAALADTDIKVCGIATPFFKCDIDSAEEREQHMDILRKCIALAHELDTSLLRCFAFWETGKTEQRWQEIVDAYEEPLRLAEAERITLGMENEASTSLSTAALTRRFIDELGSGNVRAIWDPANELYADAGITPFPDAYDQIKDVTVHGHMKDGDRNEAGEMVSVPVGEGLIDWAGQFARYVEEGYEDYLILETHWRPASALSEDLLNRPGGAAFSEAGEEASRYCLDNIQRMLLPLRGESDG
ncbi:sugar phosphate isomerase/epimerase [Candidatus Poribacteria bacterium]|jgi:L-ribulose-5-phosphate 3-epimerase|nr:sugar phosphate isomerase/epimerase [Candidatus Poribacteria bacterium]MBT5531414.1 sugar phosphate isomerase/epimerase [Candidatus Poribacteria bacterium]MBT5712558.1 sugar phosphate isomerase/epimerase [Candidatus Poribacteria bacterium]MBT7099093.1 sugar phosphate isomerase/epimerase [Candidatus Poribacteria bacterium]MBT7805872.1 sugar phosphate isomerase/epimerase [Candidatus Poribacteria bacterium]